MEKIIQSYSDADQHRKIGAIIEHHSSNKEDIRDTAKQLINWHNIHTILDMGCGYGWFEGALEGRFDLVCGIDYLEENENGFFEAASKTAEKAFFKRMHLPAVIDAPPGRFDLVVAAYSLYFFPEMIGEVKRLLATGGTFLVITHSESMLEEGEKYFDFSGLRKVIQRFSAENGEAMLGEFFPSIISVDYPNELVFRGGEGMDLAAYIDFKKEFIAIDVDPGLVRDKMLAELQEYHELRFNKNDRIFIARK